MPTMSDAQLQPASPSRPLTNGHFPPSSPTSPRPSHSFSIQLESSMRRFTKDKDQHAAGPSHTSILNGSYRCPSGHATRAPSESGQPTTQEDCVECNQIRTQLHQVQAEMASLREMFGKQTRVSRRNEK
ncbi:hypothetical protein EV126DRAFT_146850 [Verticillium dahliae]|uniref:Uncharacterized protein n=1 Tax=Verticillium dahliae TaxID=27337 RepID=A0AA44WKS6_VERDA|nr:Putative helicase mug81 [Verticillium dahliae VDG2]KAH6706658.1 hypothetical protein EV126DRAFT_146850 [Verticillium dahliae]PNH33284.1 hypothetical protein BJF96_g3553 [Verticillium dahliae]